MRKSTPAQISLLMEKHKKILSQRQKYVKQDFQAYGLQLAEELQDFAHKSLYIRLAKQQSRELLEKARLFVRDQLPGKINSKAKLFMWKLAELRKNNK